jgi:predicted transposase/invertase (TIGR01784 family)
MNTEDSRIALQSLVSACTKRDVSKVRVLNSELNPARLDGKPVRLDINVTFNDGEIANLEMQIEKTGDNLKNRAAYYAAILLANQANRGQDYKDIKRVYQIFFLNSVLFKQSEKLSRRYKFMEVEEHDHLTELTEIIFFELPKLERLVKEYFAGNLSLESLSEDEKWCIFLRYRDKKQVKPLINELIRQEGLMRAEKSLEKISRSFIVKV